jgi:hypothetical protein
MSNKWLLIICLFFLTPMVAAHERDSSSEAYRVLHRARLEQGGEAVLLVREAGHLLGQPFQVELRVQCQPSTEAPIHWPVSDSFSVCDLSPESVKVNRSHTALALKTKMADHDSYDQQIELGISQPRVTCQKATTVKKFSLRDLCP